MRKNSESNSSEENSKKKDSSKVIDMKNYNSETTNVNSPKNSHINNEQQDSTIPQQLPLELNKVQHRLLFLSPTVRAGLERECNKDDFFSGRG